MAFQQHHTLQPILTTALADEDSRSVAQNFLLEERLTKEQENHYAASMGISDMTAPAVVGDWCGSHTRYIWDEVYVEQGVAPATFRPANRHNLISGLTVRVFSERFVRNGAKPSIQPRRKAQ